jgi:hypothetical protein
MGAKSPKMAKYAWRQDAGRWPREADMFRFVASLFGCAHRHCTFPITARKPGALPEGKQRGDTYIVCLDCGKEFPYDWQQMKVVSTAKNAA